MSNQLKNHVILGKLSISNWEAKRKAKSVERKVENESGAAHGTISAQKSLLPGAAELEAIINHAQAMRNWWGSVSAPWFDNGMRCYNVAGHMDIQLAYGDMLRYRQGLIEAFLTEYPTLREKARFDLNDLFDETEYPAPHNVASRFRCELELMPLPDTADFRIIEGVDPEVLAQLQADADAKAQQRVAEAMDTTVRRVLEATKTLADRLAAYTAKETADTKGNRFYESWVGNVQELADLLPRLNLTGDPALTAIAAEIKASFDQPVLYYKDNFEAQQGAAQKANDIAARLAALFTSEHVRR